MILLCLRTAFHLHPVSENVLDVEVWKRFGLWVLGFGLGVLTLKQFRKERQLVKLTLKRSTMLMRSDVFYGVQTVRELAPCSCNLVTD